MNSSFTWFPLLGRPLDAGPLPIDRPFTSAEARDLGVSANELRQLVQRGAVRRMLRGVFVSALLDDTLELRALGLALVVPESAVVTDRTAAWFHGVPILPRSAPAQIPPISVYQREGTRVRRTGTSGGMRAMLERDVVVIGGVRVTSQLRTALDLGRLLWRHDALAALDGFLRIGVPSDRLAMEAERFRGFRGVVQLRHLLLIADGRAESPGESALRLHWYDAGLPRPELQWWVEDDDGRPLYRLDLALPEDLYCAEYDGEAFHTGEVEQRRDLRRRSWLSVERSWAIEVFRKQDVYGIDADPAPRLLASYLRARAR